MDYYLSVINMISVYVAITIQIETVAIHNHPFNKSTTTSTTIPQAFIPSLTEKYYILSIPNNNNENKSTSKNVFYTTSKTLIMKLQNQRTSSAIFMNDDDATLDPILSPHQTKNLSKIDPHKCTNMRTNVNVNNFETGTSNEMAKNVKAHLLEIEKQKETNLSATIRIAKHNRWIRDLLTVTSDINRNLTTLTKSMASIPTVNSLLPQKNSFGNSEFIKSGCTDNSLQPSEEQSKQCQQLKESHILSRSKRFLTFPEGSSFSVAVCITVGIIGNPRFNYMAYGLNWGVAYDLPNASWVINNLHGFSRHPVPTTVMRRRTRRELYQEIEALIDNVGYNGRECLLRALCESQQYFKKKKLSMVGEMLRVVFSLPKQRLLTRELHENSEIELYDRTYRLARDTDCSVAYSCSFSLLELALGKYSTPPPGYYP